MLSLPPPNICRAGANEGRKRASKLCRNCGCFHNRWKGRFNLIALCRAWPKHVGSSYIHPDPVVLTQCVSPYQSIKPGIMLMQPHRRGEAEVARGCPTCCTRLICLISEFRSTRAFQIEWQNVILSFGVFSSVDHLVQSHYHLYSTCGNICIGKHVYRLSH